MLFLRLATYLKSKGYDTAIVDYEDGEMALNRDDSISLIPYFDDRPVMIPESSVLILQSMTPWSIFPSLVVGAETNVFFITTLPQNFYLLLPGYFRLRMSEGGRLAKLLWHTILFPDYFKIKKFITLIEENDSLVFLDTDIVCNIQKSLNIKFKEPKILPLFSLNTNGNLYLKDLNIERKRENRETLQLGWVGRLADFKINILNRVLEDAFLYSEKHQKNIIFHIVGSGEFGKYLREFDSSYFSIKRVDYIPPEKLASYMRTLDIMFAMGTSALDSARIGLPTVRLDYGFNEVSQGYLYKLLYEVQGFSLGERIGSECYSVGEHTFEKLLKLIINDKVLVSNKCFEFYKKNHSIGRNTDLFSELLAASSLKWKLLENSSVMKSYFYSIWKIIRGSNV